MISRQLDASGTLATKWMTASAVLLVAFVLLTPAIARADTTCSVLTNANNGSRLRLSSPIVNRSGTAQWPTLGKYCAKTSKEIDARIWVEGTNGQLYNLKSVFAQAEVLVAVAHAAAVPAATPPPPPPPPPPTPRSPGVALAPPPGPITWENDFQQQFIYLQGLATTGKSPCSDNSEACLDFASKLDAASDQEAITPATFAFPIGDMTNGRNGNPRVGVVISSVLTPNLEPSPAPGASSTPNVSENTTLTLYLGNNPYQIATFTQAVGIGSTLTYAIDGHLGPGSARTCGSGTAPAATPSTNYQDFCSSYAGGSLVFNQSTTEAGTFEFCPTVSLPIPGTLGIGVAAVGCHGLATLAYDVNVAPRVGYARIVPSFALTIQGSLTAKAVVVQGEADLDLTLGEINNSSAGFIYGIFDDPFHAPGSTVLAYRPFAYYQAKALPVDLTLSLKTIWGSHVQKVFHLYAGFSETSQDDRPLSKADWYVMKLSAPP